MPMISYKINILIESAYLSSRRLGEYLAFQLIDSVHLFSEISETAMYCAALSSLLSERNCKCDWCIRFFTF